MRKFFFGNENSTLLSLAAVFCLFLGIGLPILEGKTFEGGTLGWAIYWVTGIVAASWALVAEHRRRTN